MEREKIEFDVLFVGGGPAGLAGAIRLMQLGHEKGMEPEVAVIEKGAEIGSHAVSGAVLNPIALAELIPDYMDRGCPIQAQIREDAFYFLTETGARRIPIVPKHMHNQGFYVVSLSEFTAWLAEIAEELGVNIFPGFAGKEPLYAQDGKTVIGVRTGDKGLDKDGSQKGNFEPGIDIEAKATIFAEGARGSLTGEIARKLDLFSGKMPQVFETGIKEVIQLPDNNWFSSRSANDVHTFGYPLGLSVPGGGFVYEMKDNRVSLGFLIGLSYEDPMLDIYDAFMQFKHHPFISDIIRGGKVLEQGARTVSTGGYFTIPKLAVDGAMFAGGGAGMQNTPGLKGVHVSMKSGMLAAEAAIKALGDNSFTENTLGHYSRLFEESWLKEEVFEGRNFAQAMAKPAPIKFVYLGAQYFTDGRGVRDNMPIFEDCRTLEPAKPDTDEPEKEKIAYDGELYVDKLTGVYLSKTMHREDQPSHILIRDPKICLDECRRMYRNPCVRFCPGNVYEIETDESSGQHKLKLNPSNCLHCKTCDIKDPFANIIWTCPEGGEGPGYTSL